MLQDKSRKQLASIKPYVPGKPIEEVQRELGISDVVKLASNENPLGPSLQAQKALQDFIRQAHIYPDGGCTSLKHALSGRWGLDPGCFIVGNGSDELFKLAAEAFLEPGDEVVTADPTFSEYEFAAKLMGAEVTKIPLKNYKHDLPAMAGAVQPNTKAVFVCNPNNPTGTCVTSDEFYSFLQRVPRDVLVVVDEAYKEYVRRPDYPDTLSYLGDYGNVLVTRTFSKVHGLAALRIGYGMADAELISILEKTREPFNVNGAAQAAATAAIGDEDHVERSIDVNEGGKQFLYEAFAALDLEYVPTDANFVLLHVGTSAERLFHEMLRFGVIVRSAHVFGLPEHLRITVGTEDQNRRLIAVLKEVIDH